MSTGGRVMRNSAATLVSQLFSQGLRAIYVVLVGRYLSEADFGFYSFALSICLVTTILSTMGLETILVREIACLRDVLSDVHARGRTILGSVLLYESLLAIPVLLLLAGIAHWRGYAGTRMAAFMLLAVGLVFRQFSESLIGVLRGYERMEYEMVFSAVEGLGLVGLLLFFRFLNLGFIGVFCAYATTYVLEFAMGFLFLVRVFFKPSFAEAGRDIPLLSKAVPVGIARFAGSLNTNAGPLLLPLLRTELEAGIYGAAYQPLKGLFLFTRSLGVGVLPVFSQLYGQRQDARLESSAGNSLRFITILVLPLTLILLVFPGFVLGLLYGSKFAGGASVLRVLSLVILLTFLNTLLSNLLVAMHRQRIFGWGRTLAVAVNLGMLLWLTPYWGALGPAVSLLSSEAVLFAITIIYLMAYSLKLPLHRSLSRPALASPFMAAVLWLGRYQSPWLIIPLALVVYVGALILVGGLVAADLRLLLPLRDMSLLLLRRVSRLFRNKS